MKTPNMKAFEGQDFDCVFWDFDSAEKISTLTGVADDGYFIPECGVERGNCRPRLNHAQLIDDISWLPNGFMWNVVWINRIADEKYSEIVDSRRLKEIASHDLHYFISAACVGLSLGYKLEGMEVYTEVVK